MSRSVDARLAASAVNAAERDAQGRAQADGTAAGEQDSKAKRGRRLAVLSGLGALLLASEVTICPTAGIWGVPCPGCGMSRASLLLLTGQVGEAIALQPLVVVVLPLVIGLVVQQALQYVRGQPIAVQHSSPAAGGPRWRARLEQWVAWLAVGLALALVLVWGLRFLGYLGGPVPVAPWLPG